LESESKNVERKINLLTGCASYKLPGAAFPTPHVDTLAHVSRRGLQPKIRPIGCVRRILEAAPSRRGRRERRRWAGCLPCRHWRHRPDRARGRRIDLLVGTTGFRNFTVRGIGYERSGSGTNSRSVPPRDAMVRFMRSLNGLTRQASRTTTRRSPQDSATERQCRRSLRTDRRGGDGHPTTILT
jgi:hypothetical protein